MDVRNNPNRAGVYQTTTLALHMSLTGQCQGAGSAWVVQRLRDWKRSMNEKNIVYFHVIAIGAYGLRA
jgi:hypothetical protein